ncbi:MAG: anti-sigma F factor [Clostridia bacterium]|nr:anti-sigma F factor [Clostridia bacterium]
MNLINEVTIHFPSVSINESFARNVIATFLLPLDPTIEELNDIKTAVSEAVTNCIVHAYKDSIGMIYITAKIFEDGLVNIKIRDRGKGIKDVNKAMQPLYTTDSQGERSGLGFAVMQSFMDSVKVSSRINIGTSVMLGKRLIRRRINKNDG